MEHFEVITPTQTPTEEKWKLLPLFKQDASGKNSTWQVGFDGTDRLVMRFGKVGGVIRITKTEVVPKCKRTMQEQALQEARHRYDEKYREDAYRPEGEKRPKIPQPMLANKWDPNKTRLKYPVWTQPKLDGIRNIAYLEDEDVYMRSRNNKAFYFLDHIRKRIAVLLSYLPKKAVLDGEFYSFVLPFNAITSIVRQKKKPHPDENLIQYFIFDVILPDNPPFEERYQTLLDAYQDCCSGPDDPIKFVDISEANSKEDLIAHHDKYVQLGYEGLIIRKIAGNDPTWKDIESSQYKFGRGSNLLKYKEFIDEEVEVLSVREASGTEEGSAIVVVKDIRGNEISVRFRSPLEERKKWFENPELIIGKQATIRYQELTPDGIPRFPVGVVIRDYE